MIVDPTASPIAYIAFFIALWLLTTLVTLLVLYWVLRLAIFHAMRAHTLWIENGKP
jgi:hypothetical protein